MHVPNAKCFRHSHVLHSCMCHEGDFASGSCLVLAFCLCENLTIIVSHACRMEKTYTAVLAAQKAAIGALHPGKPLLAAHAAAVASLTSSGELPLA
jgi:hypothetical protein